MSIREILARRDAIRVDLRAILEAHPDGALPDDIRQKADNLEAEAARLNDQERRQALIDEMDRRAAGGVPIGGSGDDRFDALAARVSAIDVIRAQCGFTDAGTGRAREVSRELEKRSGRAAEGLYWPWRRAPVERRELSLTTGGGSNLIQTDVSPATIDILRNKSVMIRGGATVMADLIGDLAIPRLNTSATVSWVTDGTALTPSNPNFDQLTFSPHQAGGTVGISRQILQQSSPDVARVIENDLTALIGTGIDQAALNGTGPPEPIGILNSTGLPLVIGGDNGAAITYANIQALIGQVDESNALDGRLAFVTNAKVCQSMRATRRTEWDTASNMIQNTPGSLCGYPCYSTQNVPSTLTKGTGTGLSAMLFGDLSGVYIAAWSMLDIMANPFDSAAFASGAVLVRAMCTVDVGIRHLAGFACLDDIIAPTQDIAKPLYTGP
jgi:HK97 family phage major capsid protein